MGQVNPAGRGEGHMNYQRFRTLTIPVVAVAASLFVATSVAGAVQVRRNGGPASGCTSDGMGRPRPAGHMDLFRGHTYGAARCGPRSRDAH